MLFQQRLLKSKIGMPKAWLHLDNHVYANGGCINGQIEVKGGRAKNKIKRYDIDLITVDHKKKEETINSRSVFCSHDCSPDKTGTFSFVLNIPENIEEKASDHKKFCVMIRVVMENAQSIIQKYPIIIKPFL
ncbi:sporulation protein [Falsibacillus albus]|nr:sporulation protein [Falsibacillus albus]